MSSRLRRIRRERKGGKIALWALRLLAVLAVMVVVVVALGATLAYAYVQKSLTGLPDVKDPTLFRMAQPTKVYSADKKLLANFYLENREVRPLSQISTDLVHAQVAVEDERFFQHKGVDTQGLMRAAIINVLSGSTKEGASTITQQYIRNTILQNERYEISIKRKLREMVLASELEKIFTKNQILEKYLNTVYFGDGAYGAEAAARSYFGKSANKLTLAEAALLAGLPQSPLRLNPYYNVAGAKARQRWVLGRMVANKYITQVQADEADKQALVYKKSIDPSQGIYDCGYFVSYIRKQLLTQYPDSLVFKGGLKVYTTIDTRLQRYAERAVKSVLPNRRDPDAALVSLDPRNGYIKAMYGGRNYNSNHYNTATQGRRQPGSSFKVFVLVTALEKGIPPSRPIDSSSPAVIPSHPPWHVSNSEGKGSGYITITQATKFSVNCVFARLIWELGAREVARTAKRMGITSPVPAFPSIALGSAPVSPLDMASAYGSLATGGILNKPTGIIKIVDADENVIYQHKPTGKRVLSASIAWAATQQLFGVVRGGTGTRAQISGREIAGKTGTAQNYQDAWFCGYTPQLSTAVWMGYLRGSIPMRNVHGQRAFGGTFCAPMWHNFMAMALKGQRSMSFSRAGAPHYMWKSSWSHATGPAVAPGKVLPKPKPKPRPRPKPGGGGVVTPPPPPPPPPDPSGTPTP